jgi:hypothetical protein
MRQWRHENRLHELKTRQPAQSASFLIFVGLPILAILIIIGDIGRMQKWFSSGQRILVAALSGGSIIISVGVFMVLNLVDSARLYGMSGFGLFVVFVQSLVIFLPALLLGLVLLMVAHRHRGLGRH